MSLNKIDAVKVSYSLLKGKLYSCPVVKITMLVVFSNNRK